MPPKHKNTPKQPSRQLETLKTSRSRCREQIDSLIHPFEDPDASSPVIPEGQSPDVLSILIKGIFQKIKALDNDITSHPDFPGEDYDTDLQESDAFELRVLRATAALDAAHNRQQQQQANTTAFFTPARPTVRFREEADEQDQHPEPAQTTAPAAEFIIRNSKEFDAAQRPEVFRGDRLKFATFMKQFEIFVSKNPRASDCERLIALRKFVADEPKQLVDALELTDANYQIALSTLRENYSRVDVDRERLLTELLNLRKVNNLNDIANLRKLVIKVQTNTKVLESLGVPFSSLAVAVQSSLNAALPPALRQTFRQWRRIELSNFQQQAPVPPSGSSSTSTPFARPSCSTPAHRLFDATADLGDSKSVGGTADSDPVSELQRTIRYVLLHIRDYEDSGYLDQALTATNDRANEQTSRKSQNGKKLIATVAAANSRPNQTNPARVVRPCLFCKTSDHNSSRCPASLSIEKRREILNKQKRCGKCFRTLHARQEDCRGPRVACGVCKSSQHYTSMHVPESSSPPSTPATSVVSNVVGGISESEGPTVMLTAQAYILNGARRLPVRVFLDYGAGLTFISPSIRRLLLNVQPLSRRKLSIDTFNSQEEFVADRFRIVLQSIQNPKSKIPLFAYERDFPVNPQNLLDSDSRHAVEEFAKSHPLADATLVTGELSEPPGIIVGLDQIYRILYLEAPKTVGGELVALNSRLGWTVGGPLSNTQNGGRERVTQVNAVCCVTTLSQQSQARRMEPPRTASKPAELVEKLWRLDTIGITDHALPSPLTADEESALTQFAETVTYDGSCYTVGFPKRPSIDDLRNNHGVALRRLYSTLKQLEKNPERYARYHREIMAFVQDGHACELESFPVAGSSEADGTYWMPHHEVISQTDSGERWRIVFDCSAKESSLKGHQTITSLNENLLPGPNLNPDLVTILINFRLHRIAVSADIKTAYMTIRLHETDQKLFRFLWKFPREDRVRAFQMKKVTWGATSSGFLLAATIREHLRKVEPDVGEQLGEHLYADDFVQSFPNEVDAMAYTDKLRKALSSADMSLAKWKSNSAAVIKHLIDTGVNPSGFQSNLANLFKVLGIAWSPTSDTLGIHIPPMDSRLEAQTIVSKRTALSIVASVYDPLGFLLPFTIRGKLLVRQIWSADLKWDDQIPEELLSNLREWSRELTEFQGFDIRRHYAERRDEPVGYSLHVFADASPIAYACAAYVEYRFPDGKPSTSLIMCKSRLAPIESPPSLPRLELLAALIAVRLKRFIVERISIQFDVIRFYTDSTIAYHWITGSTPGQWKTFVCNRVQEIQRHSSPEEWFHCAGEENIVDLATRGISAPTLKATSAWWSGPHWLQLPTDNQPISRPSGRDARLEAVDREVRHVAAPAIGTGCALPLNLDLFGSAARAVRVLANVLRFLRAARKQPLAAGAELYQEAERKIVRATQAQHFSREIEATTSKSNLPRGSKLGGFKLFIDRNGILRARTRLTQGPFFNYEEKNPVVIPGESRLAKLVVFDAHRVNAHFGVSTVLSQLRRRFWITRARQIIKAILGKCVVCKRRQGRAATQVEAPLPEPRVDLVSPFQTTGVDFCGPFFTRAKDGPQKAYIALFTCSSSRAVHLELTPLLSTPQTHLAIRRFLAEHPACLRFVSDNGRNFVKAATDIKRLFNSMRNPEVRDVLQGRQIDWTFNCARASWHGGFFERLIGVTKAALTKTLGRSLISFEELRTIIKELAAVINDRPITYVDGNPDSPSPLTPAQLLHGGPYVPSLAGLQSLDSLGPNGAVSGEVLRHVVSARTNHFKALSMRWYREYILQLRSAQQNRGRQSEAMSPGDVCLVKEDKLSRIEWPLVRIVEGHTGRDGNTRTYTIRTSNGRTTRRAAQLLIPLEVVDRQRDPNPGSNDSSSENI